MKRSSKSVGLRGLKQAFDEVRFGASRTLNLRESLPTKSEAVTRAEAWLRQQQVHQPGEVLIITGRGNSSHDGISVVREAIIQLLHLLKRRGVVSGHEEHTPGSMVVQLAPVRELWDSPKRRRDREPPTVPASPPSLEMLDDETRALLRELANRSLDALGIRDREPFVQGEMLKQFGALAASAPDGPDREARLRRAIRVALEQSE
jgi:hypothetical protein